MSPWQRSQRWVEPPPAAASGAAAGDLGLVTAKELLSAVVAANGSRQVVAATASALWRLVAASPPSAEDSDFEGLRGKVKLVEAELLVRGDISRLAGIEFTHASAARAWLCQRIEDEQGSDLAELLGQVRTGVSTLAKARNTAVHGPLRAGKQKGLSPSDASTSQDELSESTAVEEVAVAPCDGGNSGGGTSAAGYSREGSGRDAEVGSSRTATGPWVSSGGQAMHVCQGKGKGTSACSGKGCEEQYHGTVTDEPEDKFVENMEEATMAAPARAIATGGGAVAAPIEEFVPADVVTIQVTAAEGAAADGSMVQHCTAEAAARAIAAAGGAVAALTEEFLPADSETSFSRAGLAKIELEIQQATTKGAKRIAREAFRVYQIELEDAEYDDLIRTQRAAELHRVYED